MIWGRLVDLEQVGERAPRHGCGLAEDRELARENERLRREIRILKEERDILKKATQFFASQKP
jgi:transposase-like protein